MGKKKKIAFSLAIILLFIAGWSTLLYFHPPNEIVDWIGVQNGYVALFFIALFGGASTLTSTSYLATIVTLASGGLNPLLLGISGGTALAIGDSLLFYVGVKGKDHLKGKPLEWAEKLALWFKDKPAWVPALIAFLYTGVTPLPNDVLMIGLAFGEVRFKHVALSILAGSILLATLTGYLATLGMELFV